MTKHELEERLRLVETERDYWRARTTAVEGQLRALGEACRYVPPGYHVMPISGPVPAWKIWEEANR